MANKIVYGVGLNDMPLGSIGDDKPAYYKAWVQMLRRCYSGVYHKAKPTYIGCVVCDEWKTLSSFKRWHDDNYVEGFHLDKDLLVECNKVYSPETCVYVSSGLNTLFLDCARNRGEYPVGVNIDKRSGNYNTRICRFGKSKNIGTYNTVQEASDAYQSEKRKYVLEFCDRQRGIDCDKVLDIIVDRWE